MGVLDTLAGATPSRRTVKLCVDGALQAQWDTIAAGWDTLVTADGKIETTREALQAQIDNLETQREAAAETDTRTGDLANPTPATADLETRLAALREQIGALPEPYVKTRDIAEDLDALRDKIAASEVAFAFENVDWTERLALQSEHPPRDAHLIDKARGFNIDTFTPVILRRSIVTVTGAGDDEPTPASKVPEAVWTKLLGTLPVLDEEGTVVEAATRGTLNARQVTTLVDAALAVNEGTTTVPPSARSLLESQDFGASSKRPGPGTSRPAASGAGSRPTSPRSSTTKKKAPSRARSGAR